MCFSAEAQLKLWPFLLLGRMKPFEVKGGVRESGSLRQEQLLGIKIKF